MLWTSKEKSLGPQSGMSDLVHPDLLLKWRLGGREVREGGREGGREGIILLCPGFVLPLSTTHYNGQDIHYQ